MGKNTGAILGGFVLGILEALSVAFIPAVLQDAVAFAILLLILYFRPKGVLGVTLCRQPPMVDSDKKEFRKRDFLYVIPLWLLSLIVPDADDLYFVSQQRV